jgi:serine phosphatase RsbU (regulator of sigma subunit)/anti-sigma regulatory factor (Ser/Thr protein kinase)
MFRKPVKEINAEFVAEERYLDSIQRIVREACAAAGMARKSITAVLLAVEEGATNIIRHAYLYEKGTMRLRIVIYRRFIAFSLIDSGRSFHPQKSGKVDLQRLVESGRKGGLGFYMIGKIMDSVEYISAAGFNELRMIKRLTRVGATATPTFLRRLFTLRAKFSFFTFVIVSVIIVCSFFYLNQRSKISVQEHLQDMVMALGTTIADQAAGYFINSRSDVEFDELIVSYIRSNPVLVQVVLTDATGLIRAHSADIGNIRKPYSAPEGVDTGSFGVHQIVSSDTSVINYVAVPIRTGGRSFGVVHTLYSSQPVDVKLTQLRNRTMLFTGALLLVGILGIYLLSNYFVKPIARIVQRVRRFTSGDLESELPLEGADEFFEIARALNEMMARLSKDRRNVIERERLAKEIEVASQIQKTLLPADLPSVPYLEIDSYYRAASVVGGDLYDVFQIGDGRYCLVVADVSGKGVPASLVMSMLRTVIQINARGETSSRGVLLSVHKYLENNMPPGMFVTVLLAIYDPDGATVNFVSAGHNPMLYYSSATGKLRQLNPAGMPLGVPVPEGNSFTDRIEEISLDMKESDLFFMYTSRYGMSRLTGFLSDLLAAEEPPPLVELSKAVVDEIDQFSGFAKQNDDITFMFARRSASRIPPRVEGESASHTEPAPKSPGIDDVSIEEL